MVAYRSVGVRFFQAPMLSDEPCSRIGLFTYVHKRASSCTTREVQEPVVLPCPETLKQSTSAHQTKAVKLILRQRTGRKARAPARQRDVNSARRRRPAHSGKRATRKPATSSTGRFLDLASRRPTSSNMRPLVNLDERSAAPGSPCRRGNEHHGRLTQALAAREVGGMREEPAKMHEKRGPRMGGRNGNGEGKAPSQHPKASRPAVLE